MASWDVVDVDFGGDETGNFGPRLESGSALYQVDTTALITSNDEIESNPVVRAAAVCDQVCVAAGPHVSFLGDEGHKYFITLAFESEVDVLAWDHTGNFLVIGENNGSIHLLDALTQMPVFSKTIVPDTTPGKPTFAHIGFSSSLNEDICDVLVLTTTGLLYCLNNLNIAQLQSCVEDGNLKVSPAFQANLKFSAITVGTEHTEGTTSLASVASHGRRFIVTSGYGESTLCLWDRDNTNSGPVKRVHCMLTGGIVKIAVVQDGRFLLALTEEHTLTLWHLPTLTMLRHWTENLISDFLLLEPGQEAHRISENWSGVKLALTLMPSPEGSTNLLLCSLPNLMPEYSLQLSSPTLLVHVPPQQEAIFVVEGVNEKGKGSSDVIDTLRLRCLTEGQPDVRYSRLLHKRKFEAAEKLAQEFSLDVELVYKVKANWLLDCLSPWWADSHEPVDINKVVEELQACLTIIKDDGHVVDCCLKATPPSMETTWELFNYAKGRLSRPLCSGVNPPTSPSDEEEAIRGALMTQVLEAMHRLTTFHMAFGPDQFTGWDHFQKADMLVEFLRWLSSGSMSIAFCLWRRHWNEFDEVFNEEVLENILASIPETVPSDVLRPWLSDDFIPYVIRKLPESLDKIAVWLDQRTRMLEILEKEHWPKNGIMIAELLQISCVSISQSTCQRGMVTAKEFAAQACCLSVAYSQVNNRQLPGSEETDAFADLHMLIMDLRDLLSLKTKYNCRLTLDEYRQECTESITYRMLDRVAAVELVPSAIQQTVRPYMKEHHLNEDKMLFQYIGDLADRHNQGGSQMGESVWEPKAIAVIDSISDPEYKCKAIQAAVRWAYVPWSEDMEALVKDGLALNHQMVAELKEQCRTVELRKLLIKYDLRRNKMLTEDTAQRLLQYIICQDRETAIADALAAVSHFDRLEDILVYYYRLIFLVEGNRVEEAIHFMKGLPRQVCIRLGQRFIDMAITVLDSTIIILPVESQREMLLYTYASCRIISLLLTLHDLENDMVEQLSDTLKTMQNIHALQVEFGVFPSHRDYQIVSFREDMLSGYTVRFFKNPGGLTLPDPPTGADVTSDRKPGKQKKWSYNLLYRLSDLLKVSKDAFDGRLAITAACTGQIDIAIKRALNLHHHFPGPSTAAVLYQVAYHVVNAQAEEKFIEQCSLVSNLAERVHELTRLAVTHCEPGLLVDCLELCKTCKLALDVAKQTDTGDYDLPVKPHLSLVDKLDPYEQWTFEPFYQEDGLVLDWTIVAPLAYRYVMACVPEAECQKRPPYTQARIQGSGRGSNGFEGIQALSKKGLDLIQHLQENSQINLALQYSLDIQANIISYLARCSANQLKTKPGTDSAQGEDKNCHTLAARGTAILRPLIITSLTKIFKQRRCDRNLALTFMMALSIEAAIAHVKKLNSMAGYHYKQIMNVAVVGIDFAEFHNEPNLRNFAVDVKERAQCGHKLTKLKISFDTAYKDNTLRAKKNVLTMVAKHKAVDVDFLKQFCSDLKLEQDHALLLFIEHQILKPLEVSEGGDVEPITLQPLLQRVRRAISYIKNTEELATTLKSVLQMMSPYDHQRIQFVVDAIDDINPSECTARWSQLLGFLIPYERQAKPSAYEVYQGEGDEDLIYSHKSTSPLAESRLPFHPLISEEPWKIIMHELNEKSFTMWLPIARLLQLPSDQLYMLTIRNIVNQHVEMRKAEGRAASGSDGGSGPMDKAKCNWSNVDGVNHKLFEDIRIMMFSLSNCEAAMTCGVWIVKQLPMGTEKVLALKCCVTMAEKWVQACPDDEGELEKANAAYHKFFDAWCRLSTEQLLFQHGLGEPNLLALAPKPKDLIIKLYEHPSIQQRTTSTLALSSLPDIHAAVEGIASIHRMDITKLRVLLLEQWLPSALSSKQDEADMTITMDMQNMDLTVRSEEDIWEDEINLKRVSYLLQYGTLSSNTLFLLNYTFKQETTKITTMCRVRALRCLFSLVGKSTIEKQSSLPFDTIKNYLQTFVYMAELERLHITHTQESFTNCNKDGLVRGIWRNHRHEKRAVRLVADLCLDYNITDVQLWNSVLKQLHAFDMVEYLRHVLMRLSAMPSLWPAPSIPAMWRVVLLQPLASAVAPLTESQEEACLQSAALLHRCPSIQEADLLLLAKHYVRLEMAVCALACLILLPQAGRRQAEMARLLAGEGLSSVLNQLTNWADRGRQIPNLEQIENEVYQYVDDQKLHEQLEGTRHLAKLAMLLLKKDAIDNLVIYSICNDKLTGVIQLLAAYENTHPTTEFSQQAKNLDDNAKLRLYVQLKGLEDQVEGHLPEDEQSVVSYEDTSDYQDSTDR